MYLVMDAKQQHYNDVIKPKAFIRRICKNYNIPREYFGMELDYVKLIDMYENYCNQHKIKFRKVKRVNVSPRNKYELSRKYYEAVMSKRIIQVDNDWVWNPNYSKSVDVA
tara:strand:+ start:146 stop:475 length:330 start_codon:yes stop_codon:yes gene_type:complete